MPRYQVTLDGKTFVVEGDRPPTEDEARQALGAYKPTATAPEQPRGWLDTAKDVAIGIGKGAGATVANLGEMAANAGVIPGVTPAAFNDDMRHPVFRQAETATTASNDAQRVGKFVEGAAEVAAPVAGAVRAIPRAGRAAAKFARVATAAKTAPVNIEAPGQVALRISQLAERGGTMPRMVRQFLGRVTDPNQAPVLFDEGRDFYSNISRLSADEYGRLTAPIQREVGNLRSALNASLQDAAGTVGKGAEYGSAMKEYAQAAKLNAMKSALVEALKRGALPAATMAGAGYMLGNKLKDTVSGLFDE